MPVALLNAYIEMQPRIDAERQLKAIDAVALGFGAEGDGATKYLDGLRKLANPDPPKPKLLSPNALAKDLRGWGIAVEKR